MQKRRLNERYARGDFKHQQLTISREGLIEETAKFRTIFPWDDGVEVRTMDDSRSAILFAGGWLGSTVINAKGIEDGDYNQFLADVRTMAAKYRELEISTLAQS